MIATEVKNPTMTTSDSQAFIKLPQIPRRLTTSVKEINSNGSKNVEAKPRLWRAGANYAADSLLIRHNPNKQVHEVLVVQRANGQWAVPGGFIDYASKISNQETPLQAGLRELKEEAVELNPDQERLLESRANLLYSGICKDPRNFFETQNFGGQDFPARWIESKAFIYEVSFEESERLVLRQQDTKEIKDIRWLAVNDPSIKDLYADHARFIKMAQRYTQIRKNISHEPLLADLSQIRNLPYEKIGILGGTFDPPQLAHQQLAEVALNKGLVDCVIYLPAGQNPLKELVPNSGAWQRTNMLRLMLRENSQCYVCPSEIFRSELSGSASYTIDTVTALKQELRADQSIHLIFGSDVIRNFDKFKAPNEILKNAHLITVARNGQELPDNLWGSELIEDANLPDISSTTVREYLSAGNITAAQQLLDPLVWRYIQRHVPEFHMV